MPDDTLGPEKEVYGFPDGAKINFVRWSQDGQHISFSIRDRKEDNSSSKLRVWVANGETGEAKPLIQSPDIYINAVFNDFVWVNNSTLLVCTIPLSRGDPPKKPLVPSGLEIRSNEQKIASLRFRKILNETFVDYETDLFEYYTTAQLVLASLDGTVKDFGPPAVYTAMDPSPDGNYILISSSYRPYTSIASRVRFPEKVDVWKINGRFVRELCDLHHLVDKLRVSRDMLKRMHSIKWRSDMPSILYWVEAQDGGDTKVKVSPRDIIYTQPAEPIEGEQPAVLLKLDLCYGGISWCDDSLALVYEFSTKTRQIRTWVISPGSEDVSPRILLDSVSKAGYSNPIPMFRKTSFGTDVIAKIKKEDDEGTYILLNGSDTTPKGDIPFLDLFDIHTGSKERIWQGDKEKYHEYVVSLMSDQKGGDLYLKQLKILTSKESLTENTQFYLQTWPDKKACQITNFPNPYPQLASSQKETIRYQRKDGVQLTATLHLPPGYDASNDGPLPCLMWCYPSKFEREKAAGKVRFSKKFPNVLNNYFLLWLARGFAILDRPTIPFIGESNENASARYVEEMVASAEAAVEEVVRRGVAHPNKIAVRGYSYGAFTTANLLAHAPHLFCCGIACSGSYNRVLTPFGFQYERRTLREATNNIEISPFFSADKIKKPILLIHGENDDGPATNVVQSRLFFNALKAHKATCRLVVLPFEKHVYVARESFLHFFWETDRWLQHYCVSNTSTVNTELDTRKDGANTRAASASRVDATVQDNT